MTVAGLPLTEFLGAACGAGAVSAFNSWVVDPLRSKKAAREAGREAAAVVLAEHEATCPGRAFLQPLGADLGAGK